MNNTTFTADIKEQTGINVNRCYQCGKCSAGCVLNSDMDYPPSMVMRMLQTGEEENYRRLLQSETIWLCVSCQNCVTRCPMTIDIPTLMDYLRARALAEKTVNRQSKQIVRFHRSFLDSVRYTGRLYEVGLVADYKMRSWRLLQDLALAPRMFLKGKLPLIPEVIRNRRSLKQIFKKTEAVCSK
jgi:heterodisulfide reductase subunit C